MTDGDRTHDINEELKEVTVRPFSEQAKLLEKHIKTALENNFGNIVIIGQSQGSLIPAFCDLTGVSQVIGISPFFHTSKEDIVKRYSKSKDNIIYFDGTTRRKRSDGTTTIMPKEYWQERFRSKPEEAYNLLAKKTQLALINGLQDEIMSFTNLSTVKYSRITNTDGDHDFNGVYRDQLGGIVYQELANSV